MHELYKNLTEAYVSKAMKKINELERKRYSLPKIELTDLEFDTLVAIAQGRCINEIEPAIKNIDKNLSYNKITGVLMRKFEAFNMAHTVCKAILMKIITPELLFSEE
ncbi:MAG: hypothetical protein NC191_03135 [Muribaculaceae bacterium]|nr:hypothetical protein [Muribaculaceae bacterium]